LLPDFVKQYRTRNLEPMDLASVPLEVVKGSLEWAYSNAHNLPWGSLPEQAVEYIKAHPGSTAIQVASVSVAVCPVLFAAPALGLIGFSSAGPVAGSAAAGYQSLYGATWLFSGMQSAAMHGYALPLVNSIVQVTSVATAGVVEIVKRR